MFKQKLILELTFISLLSWISILEVQAQEYWFSFAKEDGLPSNEVKSITIDSNGNIWAGTYEGIGYFNSITHQWKIYKEGRALYPITVDDSGYVWAGDDITQSILTGIYLFFNLILDTNIYITILVIKLIL